MKNKPIVFLASLLFVASFAGSGTQLIAAQSRNEDSSAAPRYEIRERGANHRVWNKIVAVTNEFGRVDFRTNQAYVELSTGMHYLENGQWRETKEEFTTVPGWAVAHNGPHKVNLAYNLNTAGPVAVQLPDGRTMRSQVLSLYYLDLSTGMSVRLAEIKDCAGKILPPNRLIYEDAFTDIKADVRFTYTKGGIEQDVILRQRPPEPEDLGLNPDSTRLVVMTEFFDPPAGTIRSVRSKDGEMDEDVDLDVMRIGRGKAFSLGTNQVGRVGQKQAPVIKKWRQINGRYFLLEEVSLPAIRTELEKLPEQAALAPKPSRTMMASLELPDQRTAVPSDKPLEIAQFVRDSPGFVLDYLQLNSSQTNYTFRGDTTYYISGGVNLYGTTVFEGGTVLKYDPVNGHNLTIADGVVTKTSSYRPAVFTSKHDNSIGETISGSSGSPSPIGIDAYYFVLSGLSQVSLRNLRMSYSYCSFTTVNCSGVDVSDLQILHSAYPFWPVSTSGMNIRNALIHNTGDVLFWLEDSALSVEHMTVNQCNTLGLKGSWSGTAIAMTNCLLVGVSSLGDVPLTTNNVAITSSTNVFQQVGAGYHYLATNSPYRDVGTTSINALLLDDLKRKTTYPPVTYSNVTISANTTLTTQAPRDTDVPDLGYHYDPLDYLINVIVTNATLTLSNGVAVGMVGSYGFSLWNSGSLSSAGSPNNLNRIARYSAVQEQSRNHQSGNLLWASQNAGSMAAFHFTQIASREGTTAAGIVGSANSISSLTFRDCRLSCEVLTLLMNSSVTLANNVLDRCIVVAYNLSTVALDFDAFNNLVRGGTFALHYQTNTSGGNFDWRVTDNLFDQSVATSIYNNGNPSRITLSHNGFTTGTMNQLGGTNNKTNLLADFQTGPLGAYYYPDNGTNLALLVNAGSRNAGAVGFYHFTTKTNQVKEQATMVDIGYHYVSVDTATGLPIDSDWDGIPDYLDPDSDGDNLSDYDELTLYGTDPTIVDTDGDGRTDWQEIKDGTNPNDATSYATWPVIANSPLPCGPAPSGSGLRLTVWYDTAWRFRVDGGIDGLFYDLFASSNLEQWQWFWYGRVTPGACYELIDPAYARLYYIVGTPQDWDTDGLTDAYEGLITGTSANSTDSDTDGVSDPMEIALGRNPGAADGVTPSAPITLEVFTPLSP